MSIESKKLLSLSDDDIFSEFRDETEEVRIIQRFIQEEQITGPDISSEIPGTKYYKS